MGSKIKIELIITTHAYKRAKERMGLSKEALDAMALKAYLYGKVMEHCKGNLQKWLMAKMSTHGSNNIKLYGSFAYVYTDNVLVTVLHIPNDLKPLLNK